MGEEATRQLVQHFRDEASAYRRQWTLSLGIGCGGAAIVMMSLAANLPDPEFAFRLIAPSLWCFLVGITAAAASLPVAALRSESLGLHYAESFNRDNHHGEAKKIPEILAFPPELADRQNALRNAIIKRGDQAHERAEAAWRKRTILNGVLTGLLIVSAASFLVGVLIPLLHVTLGGSLAPSTSASG